MRTLVHLSDMHFGRVDDATVAPLIKAVHEAAPDLVVVSGDLTQRARKREFAEARDFLAQLPQPQLVVPGNHDVPLYNLFRRFLHPLSRYRRYIHTDLEPFFRDEEIAVLGINTARSLTFKNGRINVAQIFRLREFFGLVDDRVTKIVVTHHPFDLPREGGEEVVGRAALAMEALAACGADLLLAGHLHASYTGDTAFRYPMESYSALVVHAGTATSTRGRGELNAFNVVRISLPVVTVQRLAWRTDLRAFQVFMEECYEHTENRWLLRPAGGLPPA